MNEKIYAHVTTGDIAENEPSKGHLDNNIVTTRLNIRAWQQIL